ncbi:MAG: cysteine--tRNA ligase [Pantoea sp. Brub]|nr:cysteine--tRNA ligase [Pantoea sp. Brub]
MLKIYNTFSHKKEEFKPININNINMYVCGITVYDFCHIGHGRTFIMFDVIARYLRYLGYNLNYMRNITDIDDKIIKYANKNGEKIENLTERMIKEMHKDFSSLNILPPNLEPRATHHITDIINIIEKLILNGFAYISNNGDVMFDISKYSNYGILSRQKINKLQVKKYIIRINEKRNPADFVLWKISKTNEPFWSSPWGNGRPGWHIECSAMNYKQFGKHFDIHGGGSDLIFPHHENEIAQSSCAHGNFLVNYWIHTGMVITNRKKMSKSLGNFFTLKDLLLHYNSEVVRYFLMSSHYRSPLNYCEDSMKKSSIALDRLYTALLLTNTKTQALKDNNITKSFDQHFHAAMNDDFNTPEVYSLMFYIVHEINRIKNKNELLANTLAMKLRKFANILGILQENPTIFLKKNIQNNHNAKQIHALINSRNKARMEKNWIKADLIRNQLNKLGILIEDRLTESTWKYK